MGTAEAMAVFVEDEGTGIPVPKGPQVSVLKHSPSRSGDRLRSSPNVFVLSTVSGLPAVAEVIRSARDRGALRAVFLRGDSGVSLLGPLMSEARLRSLRNLVVHSGPSLPARVLRAWSLGAQTELVADASIVGDHLLVRDCALNEHRVPVADIPVLARLSGESLRHFEVSSSGSYLHWPDPDIHLGLDAIRHFSDPDARRAQELERLAQGQRFGLAVAAVRKAAGLRQVDVEGLSERQLRRIERGDDGVPRMSTLEKLAAAHSLSSEEYLARIAEQVAAHR
jgi:hypothetical protein